ncbi:hypothetical protein FRC00_006382 [Tulasnella sp. 408]|nr:hypothetical protein FRC00_006382 [Tulasnella sp. 408]
MLDLQDATPPGSIQLDESDSDDDSDGEPEASVDVNVEVTMEYDIDFPPPKPGPEWTRFVCISDSHGQRFRVPQGDVLLHAGDLTRRGKISEIRSTVASLRHPYKIVIAGNHDRALDPTTPIETLKQSRELDHATALNLFTSPQARASNIHYLNCETFQIPSVDGRKSWKVYGSPWTPWYRGLSFNYKKDMAQEIVGDIPSDADIV